jgi:hypothetical protein
MPDTPMSRAEIDLFLSYGVDPDAPLFRPAIRMDPRLRAETVVCRGDGERGCLTRVPASRVRCRFCHRTIQMKAITHATGHVR